MIPEDLRDDVHDLERLARRRYEFYEPPTLPLVHAGRIRYLGWDVTDRWAIDSDGQVWTQRGAHGGPLYRVDGPTLLAMADDDEKAALEIAEALGVPPRAPVPRPLQAILNASGPLAADLTRLLIEYSDFKARSEACEQLLDDFEGNKDRLMMILTNTATDIRILGTLYDELPLAAQGLVRNIQDRFDRHGIVSPTPPPDEDALNG